MAGQSSMMKLGNEMMKSLLRSPLHKMISGNTMLVTVKGRKSGKLYTTPVNYKQNGNDVYVISQRGRTWWRNVRGGAEATLTLRGQVIQAQSEVVEEKDGVAAHLAVYLARDPKYARYFNVSLTPDGRLNHNDIILAAAERVFVIFKLKV